MNYYYDFISYTRFRTVVQLSKYFMFLLVWEKLEPPGKNPPYSQSSDLHAS